MSGTICLPRITMVTPCAGDFLEDTIRSVVSQDYPTLDYIVVVYPSNSAGSSAVSKYEGQVRVLSLPQQMNACDALNRAFAESSGEIMGWLEPGEMLHTKGLFALGTIFAAFPEIEWITGRPFNFSRNGLPTGIKHLERWSRKRFLAGANKYIHRDTTFWRRSLWERAGSGLNSACGTAADFDLFVRFFRHARLYSADVLIGGYRTHPGQHSPTNDSYRRYNRLCDEISDRELATLLGAYPAKVFRQMTRLVAHVPKVRSLWHKYVLRSLYRCPGPDWHPKIVMKEGRWALDRRGFRQAALQGADTDGADTTPREPRRLDRIKTV
jgi:glycosyltransferase involved in cell wall biosynthesis